MANPTVNITNKQNASEPSTQGVFLLQRSSDNLNAPLTVKITIPPVVTSDGSTGTSGVDYQALPTSVTFAAGQDKLELPLIPIDDKLPESVQTVKVSLVADAAYTIGADGTASVLITDDEVVSVIPPGITKTAAEAGYTIKKLTNAGTGSSYYDVSGSQAVWQEGAILDGSLWLFNGTETKKISTDNTSPSSKKYGVGSLVTDSASIDNGRVVWQQRVDETFPYVGTIGVDRTFFYDGANTIDLGKGDSKDKPNIAGDRVVWTADDGIHVYSISAKTNILIPDSKDAVNVEIDAGKSISWSQKVDSGRKDGPYSLSDQVLKLYDGTQAIEVIKLSATSLYSQPASIQSFVSNNKVVWAKANGYTSQELFLYDGSKNIKISEDLGIGNVVNFGIEGDRVFYRAVVSTGRIEIGRDFPSIAARYYNIASGTTESVFEKPLLSSDGIIYNMPNSDGKNTAWTYGNIRGGAHGIYLDDGTTRVSFQDPTPGDLRSELFPEVSGSNVIFGINTVGRIGEEFYLATKDNVSPVANNVPTISISAVDTNAAETIAGAPPNPGSISLKRTGDTSKSLVVYYQVSNTGIVTIPGVPTNGVDYELLSGNVTFAAGSADARVDINIIDDTLVEGDESLQFNLIANTNYVYKLDSSIARLVITDNEAATPPPAEIIKKSNILWRNDYGSVGVWQMDGTTVTNAALTSIQSVDSSWKVTSTGDFNGDKKSDILWRNASGAVVIWQMDGSSVTSSSLTSTPILDNSWKTAGTGDFNGDGKTDILWRNDDGAVVVWQMDGSTVTSSSLTSTPNVDGSWKTAGTGDFNGDGKTDILWRNDDGSVALWQMNGSTVTSSSLTSTPNVDGSWKINGTGDFNGDSKTDILWSNANAGAMAIWQMNGDRVVSSTRTSSPLPDPSWTLNGIGDFTGDGKSDVLWRNTNNTMNIWQMNGSTVVSSSLISSPADGSHWKVAGVVI